MHALVVAAATLITAALLVQCPTAAVTTASCPDSTFQHPPFDLVGLYTPYSESMSSHFSLAVGHLNADADVWSVVGTGYYLFVYGPGYSFDTYASPSGNAIAVGRVDADVYPDVVGAGYDGVFWCPNTLGTSAPTAFGACVTIDGSQIATDNKAVTLADGDGDGIVDSLLVAPFAGNLLRYTNDGAGTWSAAFVFAYSGGVVQAVETDMDGDGLLDIVALSSLDSTAYLHRATAPSVYAPSVGLASVNDARLLLVGDLTGDSVPDLVLSSWSTEFFTLWAGAGDGSMLVSATARSPRVIATNVAAGGSAGVLTDHNGDGHLDVCYAIKANEGSISTCFLTVGPGEFANIEHHLTEPSSRWVDIAVADYNGDGRDDVFVLSETTPRVDIAVANPAAATVTVEQILSPSFRFSDMAVADIDFDGRADIVASTSGGLFVAWATPGVQLADTFVAVRPVDDPNPAPTHARSIAIADLTGTGMLDVAYAGRVSKEVGFYPRLRAREFGPAVIVASTAPGEPIDVVAHDFDGDGLVDLAWVVYGVHLGVAYAAPPNTVAGAASFGTALTLAPPAAFPHNLGIGDVDGDGSADCVWTAWADGVVAYVSQCDVTAPPVTLVPATSYPTAPTVGDVDADGINDVLFTYSTSTSTNNGAIHWIRGTGGGAFDVPASLVSARVGGPTSYANNIVNEIELIDIDNDGLVDIVFNEPNSGMLLHATSASPPTYVSEDTHPPIADLCRSAVVDFDGNGVADIVTGCWNNKALYQTTLARSPWVAPSTVVLGGYGSAPECGGVPSSFACLAATMGRVTHCSSPVVAPELGTPITRCPTASFATVSGAVDLVGPLTIDCGPRGGLGFHIATDATLGVSAAVLSLFTSSPLIATGGSPFRVDGSFDLSNVTFVGASSSTANTVHPYAGLGGAIVVLDTGTVTGTDVVFRGATALVGGGAIGAVGDIARVVLTGAVFDGCKALGAREGRAGGGAIVVIGVNAVVALTDAVLVASSAAGSGGAIAVADSALSATVTLTNVQIVDSVSGEAGGAIALFGGGTASVVVDGTSVVANASAVWGGLVAALSSHSTLLLDAAVAAPYMLGDGPATVSGASISFGPDVVVGSSTAVYGGTAVVCGSVVNASLASGSAGAVSTGVVGGGEVFLCPMAPGGAGATLDALYAGPRARPAALAPLGYGPHAATPVVEIVPGPATPRSVASGVRFGGGVVVGDDAFGAVVRDNAVVLGVSVVGSDAVALGVELGVAYSAKAGGASLAPLAVAAVAWPTVLGSDVVIEVRVAGASVLNTVLVPATFPVQVRECDVGFGRASDADDPLVCAACAAGAMSSSSATTEPCVTILPCPSNSVRAFSNTTSIAPCLCVAGTYSRLLEADTECVACPPEATCAGGVQIPLARPGYFETGSGLSNSATALEFERCRVAAHCVGGNVCATGSTGLLCASCTKAYYAARTGECTACPDQPGVLVVAYVAGAVVAVVCVGVVAVQVARIRRERRVAASSGAAEEYNTLAARSPRVPLVVTIAVLFGQVVALLGTTLYEWPSSTKRVLTAFDVLNFEPAYVLNECFFSTWGNKFRLTMGLPLFVACVYAVLSVGVASAAGRGGGASFGRRLATAGAGALTGVGPLAYLPLSRASLALFDCTYFRGDGTWRLDASLGDRCFAGEWWELLPWGVVGVCVYVVGIPAGCAVLLRFARRSLFNESVALPLYRPWRRKHASFEVVQMGRRLSITAAVLFWSHTQTLQFLALLVVFAASAAVFLSVKPYFSPRINTLESALNLMLSALLLLGFVFYTHTASATTRDVFAIVAIGVVAVAVCAIAATAVAEVRARSSIVRSTRDQLLRAYVESNAADWHDRELAARVSAAVYGGETCVAMSEMWEASSSASASASGGGGSEAGGVLGRGAESGRNDVASASARSARPSSGGSEQSGDEFSALEAVGASPGRVRRTRRVASTTAALMQEQERRKRSMLV